MRERGDTADRRARALKALSHPARLAAVRALSAGERCICELWREMGCDLSTASRHLKALVDSGIVKSRREGRKVFLRLLAPCLIRFLDCLDSVLDGKPCRFDSRRDGGRRR